MDKLYDIIIIGGGVAGVKAATVIRELNKQVSIGVVTKEPFIYTKMGLNYMIKSGSPIDLFKLSINANRMGIHVLVNSVVTRIDFEKKTLKVKHNGISQRYVFNKLILATGGKPIIPDIEGVGKIGVMTFNEYDDAVSIKSYIRPGMNIYVIGAGLVGLLLADALRSKGLKVTLVDALPGIGLTIVEEEISKYLVDKLVGRGLRILTSADIERISGDRKVKKKVRRVIINGVKYEADLVVFTTGIAPNTDLVRRSDVELGVKNAIRTNERMETNVDDVYAVGDCATSMDYFTKKETYRPLGILAVSMAEIAGKNVAGIDTTYDGFIPMQYFEVFNESIIKVGLNVKEARELGLDPAKKLVKYKVPGIGAHPVSLLIHLKNRREELIGWQVISPWLASYKSAMFINAIKERIGLSEFLGLEKNIEVVDVVS